MNNEKIARQLVRIAKELNAADFEVEVMLKDKKGVVKTKIVKIKAEDEKEAAATARRKYRSKLYDIGFTRKA